MTFAPAFLDDLRARLSIVDAVGRRVRLTKRGREHLGLCPFHAEKTPSFTVSDDKGFFHCFGCGAHGDVIGFVMQTEGLAFPEAVERLAGEAGLEVPQSSPEARAAARRQMDLLGVVEAAAAWFEEQARGAAGAGARAYLAERGVDEATATAFRLGYAPSRRGLLRAALHARGVDDRQLAAAGLIKEPEGGGEPRDYFFDRVIFPITDRRGRVIAFGGRALGDSPAKYLNSPETPLFHKGRVLYNLAGARKAAHDSGAIIVAEGYMDVIALVQAGFPAAVAPLGTAVTGDQIAELWRMAEEPVLCLDGDAAGRRAAFRAAERALPLLRPGYSLRFATLPAGEDPDTLVRRAGPAAMRQILERATPLEAVLWAMETEGRAFATPERQAGLISALDGRLRAIGDATVQKAYREALNRRLFKAFGFGPWGRVPDTGRRRQARSARAGGAGHRRGAGGYAGASDVQPAGPLRHDLPPSGRLRREQVLFAALVNHPEVIVDYAETLADLELTGETAGRFRQHLLNAAADQPDLDSDQLKCHLSQEGLTVFLREILRPSVYLHGRFAQPGATGQAARRGIEEILRGLRQSRLASETEAACQRLADSMSADDLAVLTAQHRLLDEGDDWLEDREQAEGAPS